MLDAANLVDPYDLAWGDTSDEEFRDLSAAVATIHMDLYDDALNNDRETAAERWQRLALIQALNHYADKALACDAAASRNGQQS